MEASASPKVSTLRWKLLRRALLRHPPSNSDGQPHEMVSRKAKTGFNLIPFSVANEENSERLSKAKQMGSSRDACFCYVLPTPNATNISLQQRVDDSVNLNDFAVCNRYNIDNTGIVCHWPSEDVLAYYCLSHADLFRSKRVIELGSGYGLAGFVIAAVTEASEVVISDGNPQVVDYVERNVHVNSSAFGATNVKSMLLHWNHDKIADTSSFDVIVASDCTFFTEFHKRLVQTIKFLLKKDGPAEAILFSPKRGDSLDRFLVEVKGSGLQISITEMYDTEVWKQHQRFIHGDDTWPNYEPDHCYPLLIRITW